MASENEQLKIDIAVTKQRQDDMDRRQEVFMTNLTKNVDEMNRNITKTWEEINSIHGHLSRCRDELREEIDRDFVTNTEAEKIRGSVKQINTKLYMTGVGIVLVLSLVQIGLAVFYGGS